MLNLEDHNKSRIHKEIREESREERDAEWIRKLFEVGRTLERIAGMMSLDLEVVEQATGTKRKNKYDAWRDSCNLPDYRESRYYKEIQREAREEARVEIMQKMFKHGYTFELIAHTMKTDVDAVKKILKKKPKRKL